MTKPYQNVETSEDDGHMYGPIDEDFGYWK